MRSEPSLFDRDDSGNPPILKKPLKNQKVLTGRVTKARLPAKQSTKASVKTSEDVDVDAELGNPELHSAEESGTNNEAHDEEDTAGTVKVEEDMA